MKIFHSLTLQIFEADSIKLEIFSFFFFVSTKFSKMINITTIILFYEFFLIISYRVI